MSIKKEINEKFREIDCLREDISELIQNLPSYGIMCECENQDGVYFESEGVDLCVNCGGTTSE